jgi:CRP-like cAMP-binding protein
MSNVTEELQPVNVMHEIERNDLLRELSEESRNRLLPHLSPVTLPAGHVLSGVRYSGAHVWFPTSSVVTLQHVLKDSCSAQFGIVGREGAVGLPALFSDRTCSDHAVVLQGGSALKIPRLVLRSEFHRSQDLRDILMQYSWAMMQIAAQTVACNTHHCLNDRLCTWLLLVMDRMHGNHLSVTYEELANLLGVRREAVMQSARRLQNAELIEHRRGCLSILDRQGLEASACECYASARRTVSPTALHDTAHRRHEPISMAAYRRVQQPIP